MSGPARIHAKELQASYGSGDLRVEVLRGVTFAVDPGEVVAIMGPSGSGKTTLLSLVGGLDVADGGTLDVDGTDLRTLSRSGLSRYRRERVGFVFQFFNLLPTLNAQENVEAGLEPLGLPRKERKSRAQSGLEMVGLGEKSHRFPHELSGGEQQRVAVARAWAKNPPLLLADEPTGNLDEEGGARILDLLLGERGVKAGRTVLIVTHDQSVADRADRVMHLHAHHITEV